ncbi:hypothetical protein [Pelosinus fermentans]|uniref:Uncharacterized protein n=1 Tax=Pelosinus fermentans JBW45 TaxID=1192197 RepID=I8TUM3_9FIRM|nr:hypothetical protein [Pelosinus fermentans]AJQ26706.1 hypothetical protein JBW_01354 [Pelosinus fermentans JBW45]
MAKHENFQIEIGDTERSIEEIIDNIRKSNLPILHIKQVSTFSRKTGSGATLALQLTPDAVNEKDLKDQLNEYGGCMYQVASVIKS